MARLIVKLLSDDSVTDLATALTAYKGAAGAELLTAQRGQASAEFVEPDGDLRMLVALAHAGLTLPTSGNKTADLQHLDISESGTLAELQAAVDAALADALHHEAASANGDTTTPGTLVTTPDTIFAASDVGRKVQIGSEVRTITAFNSSTSVDYDNSAAEGGDFTSNTGLTVDLLGAESLQAMTLTASKSRDGKLHMRMYMAVEGEAY